MNAFFANIFSSWKTSAAGLALILANLSGVMTMFASDAPLHAVLTSNEFSMLLMGVIGLFAKDFDKSNAGNPVEVAKTPVSAPK